MPLYFGAIYPQKRWGYCIDTQTGRFTDLISGPPVHADEQGRPAILPVPGNRPALGWAEVCQCPRLAPIPRQIIDAGLAVTGRAVPVVALNAARTACTAAQQRDDAAARETPQDERPELVIFEPELAPKAPWQWWPLGLAGALFLGARGLNKRGK